MKQKIEERLASIKWREKGYSVNEIVRKVGVAKSSISTWVRNVPLSHKARERLLTKIKLGQLRAAESKHRKIQEIIENHYKKATLEFTANPIERIHKKLICALLYWCEGAKSHYQGVNFVNSDVRLVKLFLQLFRDSFEIDETKFRPCIHLHSYHDPEKQLQFWSEATGIAKNQFIQPYQKPNTGIRIKKDYPGCISIRYHSNATTRELLATADAFLSLHGGVG